jgi:hypothetical protein
VTDLGSVTYLCAYLSINGVPAIHGAESGSTTSLCGYPVTLSDDPFPPTTPTLVCDECWRAVEYPPERLAYMERANHAVRDALPRFSAQRGGIRYRSPSEWVPPPPAPRLTKRVRVGLWLYRHLPRRWVWEAREPGHWDSPSRTIGFYSTEARARRVCENDTSAALDWSDPDGAFPYSVRRVRAKVIRRVEL